MAPDPDRLFILGSGRSGTTFLGSLVNQTRFGSPVETHFITRLADAAGWTTQELSREEYLSLAKLALRERAVQQWKPPVTPESLYDDDPTRTIPSLVDRVVAHSPRTGEAAWADKTPAYALRLDQLSQLFPKARFLYVIRDGRDVAVSQMEKSWGPPNIYACARSWLEYNEDRSVIERLAAEGRLLEVRYETIIAEYESTMRHVFKFLGEPAQEEWIAVGAAKVRSRSIGRFKDAWSEDDIRVWEAVAGDTLERYGYERAVESARLSPLEHGRHALHAKLASAYRLFRLNVLDGIAIRFGRKEPFAE